VDFRGSIFPKEEPTLAIKDVDLDIYLTRGSEEQRGPADQRIEEDGGKWHLHVFID